ncbi:hypothetical protein EZ428_18285 [Pedobacter frigiditerrae]|uniref:TerB family tellurite resistance protein n=1 Tax=Pedobacter frigiditerrae TaxID=2530452 RepID=A0A4R0MP67_9SPHI|nr:hypothetical protein [Pedobacter frigiditerrae]TCC88590.1 hypothetical protein EZ428_18285 [Pedobacter frigiditerrae]
MGSSIKFYLRCPFGFCLSAHFKLLVMMAMVICGLGLGSGSVKAQSYDEIFRQKKTQEKYLLKQIAYLKLYADQAWKGYKIVSGGLETINDFTSGEFKLHEAFTSALSKVSSLVKKDFRLAEIIQFQLNINSSFRALLKSSALSPGQNRAYFRQVQENVMVECKADLDELMDIVLSGDLEMNDAERLSRLKKIHLSMNEKASFARWFCSESGLLMNLQRTENVDIKSIRRFYEKN